MISRNIAKLLYYSISIAPEPPPPVRYGLSNSNLETRHVNLVHFKCGDRCCKINLGLDIELVSSFSQQHN